MNDMEQNTSIQANASRLDIKDQQIWGTNNDNNKHA